MIIIYDAINWGIAALLAFAASLVALKILKLAPLFALVVGMAVFVGVQFPIYSHAVRVDFPPPKSN